MFQSLVFPGLPGPPPPHRDPGPGPEGPWALRLQYLAVNLEQLGSNLNAFYVELASCRGVSEAASAPHTVGLQGRARFAKCHSGIVYVVRGLVTLRLFCKHTQDIEEVYIYIYIYIQREREVDR